ncbi:MAG: nuclear transport factor 2 family protein [Nocardioidaceae bacterium]
MDTETRTTDASDVTRDASDTGRFAQAGTFVEAVAAQNFDLLASTLDPDVRMRALLPRGFVEYTGATEVAAAFRTWFGDVEAFELVDATIGDIAGRTVLRWRARVIKPAKGDGWLTIEQHVLADLAASGGVGQLDLMCSGFRPEPQHD